MTSIRLSRVRFIHPVLLSGAEYANFQETDNWHTDQSPPATNLCAFIITLVPNQQIITICDRNGRVCFSPITNLVSGNYYPSTIESEYGEIAPKASKVIIKSDPRIDQQIAIDMAMAQLQQNGAPKVMGAMAPESVVEDRTTRKYTRKSPLKIKKS